MALILRGTIYHVRAQIGGVMIAKSTKTSNKRQAELLEKKWCSEVYNETVVAGRKPITVEKAVEVFLASRRGTAGLPNARTKLEKFKPLYASYLHDINEADLRELALDLVENEKYKVSTINVVLTYWNAMLQQCAKENYSIGDKAVKLKGAVTKLHFLNAEEVTALLEGLDPAHEDIREKNKAENNRDFVIALLNTGAREMEMTTLKMSQIDLLSNTITIIRSKGGSNTTMKMSKQLRDLVLRRISTERANKEYLFPERVNVRTSNDFILRAARRAKLKNVSTHTMRHTFATKMLKAGLSIVEVQKLLGHRNIASTMCYCHVVPDLAGERAAAVLDA